MGREKAKVVNIRPLLLNDNKIKAFQSIINHRNDLFDYITNYDNIDFSRRVMSIDKAYARLRITQEIYEKRSKIL